MLPDPRYLATAVEAVVRAGDLQMARLGSDLRVSKKSEIDLVTEVDLEIERVFRQTIAEQFPDHRVLGEEMGGASSREGPCWVFDPLDGTTNYTHGLPIFCSSLALELDGRAEIAAIYDPTRKELFTAERTGGARLNGSPMRISSTSTLIDSLLCTGFPYDVRANLNELVGLFAAFLHEARAVRRLGSAAIDLCYVAAGRLDGFWEQRLNPWDIAAGALIVEEAGGQVTGFSGAGFDSHGGQIVASNGLIHQAMIDVIQAFYQSGARSRNWTN